MIAKTGTLMLMLVATFGTGCCCYDQCGYYNQCGGAYDPCTGLVQNRCDPFANCRAKRLMKKLGKDDCNCGKHDCDCHAHGCGCQQNCDGCNYGMMPTSGCPCQSYGVPTETTYGEPVYYGEPMEGYVVPDNYPELMVPHEVQPRKPVPAPAAEPDELPHDSTIPPASYVVPAPLDGPSVPVLQPYHGR